MWFILFWKNNWQWWKNRFTIKKKIKLDISTQQLEEESINNSFIDDDNNEKKESIYESSFLKENDEEKIKKKLMIWILIQIQSQL